jgi:thiol-disulfide isomerase/thioredoxin
MKYKFKYLLLSLLITVLVIINIQAQEIPSIKINELESYIQQSTKPLIINFWATFCKPCLEEIPYFISKSKQYESDSVELLLVSLDLEDYYPAKIANFAKAKNITAPIAWLNETDADLFCPKIDPQWSGAIPATLFVNNKSGYRKFYEEQLSEAVLDKEINALIHK